MAFAALFATMTFAVAGAGFAFLTAASAVGAAVTSGLSARTSFV